MAPAAEIGEVGAAVGAGTVGRRSARELLRAGERWLAKAALQLAGYLIVAFLIVKLIPSLREALDDLERPSWPWLAVVFALEMLSETGFVVSWHAIVDPEGSLGRRAGSKHLDTRLAWAQLGTGMFVPGGSFSGVGAGTWLLHRLGMPIKLVAKRQLSLSFLNTTVDAIALIVFGVGLWVGILNGAGDTLLTVLPAGVAAAGVAATLGAASILRRSSARDRAAHPRIAAALETLSDAVHDTAGLLVHRSGLRSALGAIAYLCFDVLVLFTAFVAIHAHPVPPFGVVVMAYIIGALGGSLPLPASAGSVGGMVGMLILYGVRHDTAVAAVLLYQAVGLIVPLIGGGIAYLLLRRELHGAGGAEPVASSPA